MDSNHKFYGQIAAIYDDAMKIVKPVALYTPLVPEIRDGKVLLNGVELNEPFVYKMLSGSEVVVPYAATCGQEIDEWSQSFTDMFKMFTADTLKEVCLDAVRTKMKSEIQETYFDQSKCLSTINPGSLNDWPITGQEPLFKILGGVTDDIGVVLKESMMMAPTKSVSGIAFQTDSPYHNCQLCPRADCIGRKAPYEGDH